MTIPELTQIKPNLKDNYEKAKRERQIEEKQAELEKVRLQEILDICIEFQRQEESKYFSQKDLSQVEKIQPENKHDSYLRSSDVNQQFQTDLEVNTTLMKNSVSASSTLSSSSFSSTSAIITPSVSANVSNNQSHFQNKAYKNLTEISLNSNSSNEEMSKKGKYLKNWHCKRFVILSEAENEIIK